MDQTKQQRFMYLFERVGEPLYFGPRGDRGNNVYYNVPTNNLDVRLQNAATKYRQGMRVEAKMNFKVDAPAQMPDLRSISNICPRTTLFSHFIPAHRQAANNLRDILLAQRSNDEFLSMSCACRDSDMVNPRLFVYALASSCLLRKDLKGFRMPAIWEVMPDQFIGPNIIRMAQRQAVVPEADRKRIEIPRDVTGNDSNPENKLAYFREDLGISSHHWHWHLVYPQEPEANQKRIDRKGELFYWMHHDMLARYDAERLANGLPRVQRHDLTDIIPEGYFPKLYNHNSGIIWGTRQEGSRAGGVNRPIGNVISDNLTLDWDDMGRWRTRIFEAIDTGVVMDENHKTVRLTVDILGDLLEASSYSINKRFYGDFHNYGHVAIACCHDPYFRHKEEMGVMGDVATTMRDPIFYRWHKYIDEIFDKFKGTLPQYTIDELRWNDIRVTNISVQIEGGKNQRNVLTTHWMRSDVDLVRGLDFGRTNENNLGPIWASVTHLNHEKFAYTVNVANTGKSEVTGTVRIFLAPRNGEKQKRFDFAQQRIQFMTMDKFSTVLRPGDNVIVRQSTESTVTIPWEQTFRDLERDMRNPTAAQSICGCGWPQHMLVPRGTTDGMLFDLYVIVTDGAKDAVPRGNTSQTGRPACRDAVSYCGLLDEKYPDAKAMGFPFDRHFNQRPFPDLDAFVKDVGNSKYTQVRIVHRNGEPIVRPGGAPPDMTKIVMGTPPTSPKGSPPPSPQNRWRKVSKGNASGKARDRSGGRGYEDLNTEGSGYPRGQPQGYQPYQGYGRHRDQSPSRNSWPRGWGDE